MLAMLSLTFNCSFVENFELQFEYQVGGSAKTKGLWEFFFHMVVVMLVQNFALL